MYYSADGARITSTQSLPSCGPATLTQDRHAEQGVAGQVSQCSMHDAMACQLTLRQGTQN